MVLSRTNPVTKNPPPTSITRLAPYLSPKTPAHGDKSAPTMLRREKARTMAVSDQPKLSRMTTTKMAKAWLTKLVVSCSVVPMTTMYQP